MRTDSARSLREAFTLVIGASVVALLLNTVHPRGFDLVKKAGPASGQVVKISLDEARIKYDCGALFIDSRDEAEYGEYRIAGAENVPATLERLPDLSSRRRELVLYCSAETCGAAELLAERLVNAGFKRHIYVLKGGIPAWMNASYPVERGKTQ